MSGPHSHSDRALHEFCSLGHRACAAWPQGPCNAKPTNSNPKTLARQRQRRRKRKR